jgi:hypothetical protein
VHGLSRQNPAVAPRAPSRSIRTLRFGDLPEPAVFEGCDDLVEAVRSILRGWDIRDAEPGARLPPPAIRVTRTPDGYRRTSRWTSTPEKVREKLRSNLVEALCGFHFEFIDWALEARPETLALHGAAVAFGDRLVAFPAVAKTGKSVLTVNLALHGRRVWCDDVLPIAAGTTDGISLGVVPRLRQPLPADASPAFLDFVRERRGHAYRNRLYVDLRDGEMAPYGETAPVRGIVFLTRRPKGVPRIVPLDRADALEVLVTQNFAKSTTSPRVLDTLADVVARSECWRVQYRRSDEAVALLDEAFGPPAPARRKARP